MSSEPRLDPPDALTSAPHAPSRGSGRSVDGAESPELSVVAPCYDEADNVRELARRVLATFDRGALRGELVLVDDGSRDATWARIEQLEREHPGRVVGRRHPRNLGISAGWATGVRAARGALVAIIDADLQYQPEDLLRLRRALLESSVDVVQGFRSAMGRERDARYHLSRGFNGLLNTAFGMRLSDNKSGFVMCSKAVMEDLLEHRGRYAHWQSFIMVAAHAKGYSYREVETLFEARRAGRSFLEGQAHRVAAACLVDLVKATWEYRLAPRVPDALERFALRPRSGEDEPPAFDASVGILPSHAARASASPAPQATDSTAPQATGNPAPRCPRASQSPGGVSGPVSGASDAARSTEPSKRAHPLRYRAYMGAFGAAHWLITRDVERYYELLERTQWLSPAQLGELQDDKLRRLIRHAYREVPYYRERLRAAGLTPADIRGRADLYKVPLLDKAQVREHLYFDLLSETHDKANMLRVSTSGSTGEPFVCFADRAQLELRWAATLRSQEWTGYRLGDPCVRLWHQNLGMTRAQELRERLDALLARRRFIPVFELARADLDRVLDAIDAWHPTLVDGYAEAFDLLAAYALQSSRRPLCVGAVMSSAQTLTAASRERIERAFGCRVFDKYGAREFSGIAYECEAHDGHHLVAESYIVEVLRDGQPVAPGETGEVVITDLNNRGMPLIRYRIGDLAVAMSPEQVCRCGRGLPRIGAVEGRVQSIIVGTDGRYLPGTFFAHYLRDLEHAIQRYQVVQHEPGAIVVRVVPAGRFSKAVEEQLVATFRRYLGAELRVTLELVEQLELVRTGKRSATVSHLDLDFQRGAPTRRPAGAQA